MIKNLPDDLALVLDRMIQKRVEARFESAASVLQVLRQNAPVAGKGVQALQGSVGSQGRSLPNPTARALPGHSESHPFERLVARSETVVVIPQRSIFSFDRTRETFSNHPKLSWAALAAIIVIPFAVGFALNYLRQGPSGTILVESDPVGASVACDGQDMGRRTPARFDVKIGPHSLSLRMPGYDSHDVPRFDVDESPGVKRLGPYTLNPIVVMAQIDSNPQKATVSVDGKATDVITPGRVSLPLGRHFVELVRPGYQTKILPAVECRQGEQIIDLGIFPLVAKDRVVRIASAPLGATLRLDGVLRRPTPTEVELPVGSHRIRLSLSGYDALESNFDVEAGDSVQHVEDFRLEPSGCSVALTSDPAGRGS